MRTSLIIAGLFSLFLWSCAQTASNESKNDQIRRSLKKEGINSYFRNDTLYVVDKKGIGITRIHINLEKTEKEFKVDVDTTYYIEQQEDTKHLFIVLKGFDVTSLFIFKFCNSLLKQFD